MKESNIKQSIKYFIAGSGAFCVLFGAWLSHGAGFLNEKEQQSLATALNYQFIHTLALLSVYVWYNLAPQKPLKITQLLFVAGILLFCGSIYLKTLTEISMLGKLAPFGGVTLAIAWVSLVFQRHKS